MPGWEGRETDALPMPFTNEFIHSFCHLLSSYHVWDTIRGAQEMSSLFSVREEGGQKLSTRGEESSRELGENQEGLEELRGALWKVVGHVKGLLRRVGSPAEVVLLPVGTGSRFFSSSICSLGAEAQKSRWLE